MRTPMKVGEMLRCIEELKTEFPGENIDTFEVAFLGKSAEIFEVAIDPGDEVLLLCGEETGKVKL